MLLKPQREVQIPPADSPGKTSGEDKNFSLAEQRHNQTDKLKITPELPECIKSSRGIYEDSVCERVQSQKRQNISITPKEMRK